MFKVPSWRENVFRARVSNVAYILLSLWWEANSVGSMTVNTGEYRMVFP